MQFRRQIKPEESINLTPLIDVVFLLLIFFMVSTTFTKETHLEIDLPEAAGVLQPDAKEQIEVLIHADGSYAVNGQSLINQKMETLKAALSKASNNNYDRPLIITSDAKTPFQSVVTAMDVAGQLGFVNLSMTTRNPESESSS